jgi:hypothetical protein
MTEEEKQPVQDQKEVKSDRGSKLMGDMLKGLREFGSAALDKAEEYGKIASDKAEELTKLGKIKLDLHQLTRSRSKQLAELGELVFDLGQKKKLSDLAKHENYIALVKSIKDLDAQIKEKEAHAETIEVEEVDKSKG